MWVLESDGTVLRGVVGDNSGGRGTITVYVDGYGAPFEYQEQFVFRREKRAIQAAQEQDGNDSSV